MSCSVNREKQLTFLLLRQSLVKIKGIGGKRLEEIMTVIEKFLDVE